MGCLTVSDYLSALKAARADFETFGDHASAGAFLEAAYDAWNNEEISEQYYVEEVCDVQRWLIRLGREEKAASDTHVTSSFSRYLTQGK